MSTAGRRFINEGVLRIAWFIIFASLTYTVRNYTWAIVLLMVVALYSLVWESSCLPAGMETGAGINLTAPGSYPQNKNTSYRA